MEKITVRIEVDIPLSLLERAIAEQIAKQKPETISGKHFLKMYAPLISQLKFIEEHLSKYATPRALVEPPKPPEGGLAILGGLKERPKPPAQPERLCPTAGCEEPLKKRKKLCPKCRQRSITIRNRRHWDKVMKEGRVCPTAGCETPLKKHKMLCDKCRAKRRKEHYERNWTKEKVAESAVAEAYLEPEPEPKDPTLKECQNPNCNRDFEVTQGRRYCDLHSAKHSRLKQDALKILPDEFVEEVEHERINYDVGIIPEVENENRDEEAEDN